ncbi:phosphate acyltransferase [Clostridia bacterium]|nr:phosphate acyltransferase [Clostridia bacterium]
MRIIVDAMGGDRAPDEIVRGAVAANAEFGVDITLVGVGEKILRVLQDCGLSDLPRGVEVANAEQVVTMEDKAANVLKLKPDSSMMVALKLLGEGKGDAVVSAGNTGALLSGATLLVKRIKGIRRGALVPMVPTATGLSVLIDGGANVEVTAEYLLQFAYLGAAYAERAMGLRNPKVALLNNGAEESKGTPVIKETYQLLEDAKKQGRINFVGNVEGREAVMGEVDVIVADGFTGNVFLKTEEGVGLFFMKMLKTMFKTNLRTKIAALLVSKELNVVKKKMDYAEYGGAPLLGMSKPVIKAHGASNERAIRSAIKQAIDYANSGLTEYITENIEFMQLSKEE